MGGEQQSKFSPAYYHVNLLCICNKWPMFRQHNLVILNEVAARLTQTHKFLMVSMFHDLCTLMFHGLFFLYI